MAHASRAFLVLTCLLIASLAGWTTTFADSNPIIIPSTSGGAATATTYPSNVVVSGLSGSVQTVTVELIGWTEPAPEDIYFELVAPTGNGFEFLGGVGGTSSFVALNILLADSASLLAPPTLLNSGTFLPTVLGSCVTLPSLASPKCAATIGTSTFENVFGGTDPDGTWSLYIYDPDTGDSAGSLQEWSLKIGTTSGSIGGGTGDGGGGGTGNGGTTGMPEPSLMLMLPVGLLALAGLRLRARKIAL